MANLTTNYNLKKPLGSENFNVEDQNGNMDLIDVAIKAAKDKADDAHSDAAAAIAQLADKANSTDLTTHINNTKTAHEVLQTIASATGTVDLNMTTANCFDVTLTGATTFTFSNPPATGNLYAFTLYLTQGATPQTVTYPASVKWGNDVIPDISTASKTSILVFVTRNGGTRWHGVLVNNKFVV